MQLTFLILVLCCYARKSSPAPPDPTWRPSRYIIDNRRNALFAKKPFAALLSHSQGDPLRESANLDSDAFKPIFPVEPYQKDLAAEASIIGSKFYRKYTDNALPRKVKSFKINGSEFRYVFENRKNESDALEPQNFIQNEVLNEVKTVTTEKPQTHTSTAAAVREESSQPIKDFEFGSATTTSFPWDLANAKAEEGNQIDGTNEKHVYETRIETVSYHQEVIYPPKKPNWYREELKPERNYEPPEENYEEPEKNYESPEENYEEREKNYELGDVIPGDGQQSDNQNKFGYVVEGSNYRKYRVEERTADGFIVGEYGVVSHDDGSLRGVRYTADGNTNPQLIYETLIKFLSL